MPPLLQSSRRSRPTGETKPKNRKRLCLLPAPVQNRIIVSPLSRPTKIGRLFCRPFAAAGVSWYHLTIIRMYIPRRGRTKHGFRNLQKYHPEYQSSDHDRFPPDQDPACQGVYHPEPGQAPDSARALRDLRIDRNSLHLHRDRRQWGDREHPRRRRSRGRPSRRADCRRRSRPDRRRSPLPD